MRGLLFCLCALALVGPAPAGLANETDLSLERLTVTYPQPERIATVTGQGTGTIPLRGASFDPRFDTLTLTGVWKNTTNLNFRGARLQFDLLGEGQRVLRTLLAEYIPFFHREQSSSFALLVKVSPGEGITAVRPRISYEVRTYQEEFQRNTPRFRGQ